MIRESALESIRACTLRGQLELVKLDEPIPIDEVEPASEIVKRFVTGKCHIKDRLIHCFFVGRDHVLWKRGNCCTVKTNFQILI